MTPKTFTDWYKDNKEELNAARRARYRTDKAYREQVLDRNKQARDKSREEQLSLIRVRSKPYVFRVVGSTEEGTPLFSIGALAAALGRSVQTVRKWEKAGILLAIDIQERGGRFYTEEEISKIRDACLAYGKEWKEKNPGSRCPAGAIDGALVEQPSYRIALKRVLFKDGSSRDVRLYSIGMLSSVLDRTRESVLHLENAGRFPRTPLRERGRRLYSYQMIQAACSAYDEVGPFMRGDDVWQRFHDLVSAEWDLYGAVRVVARVFLEGESV